MSDRRRDSSSNSRRNASRLRPWAEPVEPRLLLANFIVTRTDDTPNTIGGLTLRQAIEEANRAPGTDSISFDLGDGLHILSPQGSAYPDVTDTVALEVTDTPNSVGQQVVLDGSTSPTGISGLVFTSPGNTISGLGVIGFRSDFNPDLGFVGGYGIVLNNDGNFLYGNYIGSHPLVPSPAISNDQAGLLLQGSSSNNIGVLPDGRSPNLISGNTGIGILIADDSSNDNKIVSALIGTTSNGFGTLPNLTGISIEGGAARTRIETSIISGNLNVGIDLDQALETTIVANFIGLTGNGLGGNGTYGVRVGAFSSGTTIGGLDPSLGNTITANGSGTVGAGIFVEYPSVVPQVAILGNSIFDNNPVNVPGQGLGIDIGGGGVLPNRFPPNGLSPFEPSNYPEFDPFAPDDTTITGTLTGVAGTNYRLEFFLNDFPDPSGFGEGREFYLSLDVTTDPMNGTATFSLPRPPLMSVDRYLTATATSETGYTSEFSADLLIPMSLTDLYLQVDVIPPVAYVGEDLVFQILVSNDGEIPGAPVDVLNLLPATFEFVGVTTSVPATITSSPVGSLGGFVQATFASLAPGQQVLVSITTRPTETGAAINLTTVTSPQGDQDPANNEVTTIVDVQRRLTPSNLSITLQASPDPVFVDDLLTYTITVTNSGETAATDLTVTDWITSAADFVSANSIYPFVYVPPSTDPARVVFQVKTLGFLETATFQVIVRPNVAGTFGNIAAVTLTPSEGAPQTQVARVDTRFVYNFVVTTSDDSGPGSLRRVIFNANRNPGPEMITFAIPTNPVIQPLSLLPVVAGMTTIDATTQPGFAGAPVVVLNGSRLSSEIPAADRNGLVLFSDNAVKGLEVREFTGSGIVIDGGVNNAITGNYLRANGESGLLLRTGFLGDGISRISRFNTIGGMTQADRNIISNNAVGVNLQSGTSSTLIVGNYIGTDASGQMARGNDLDGILINDAPDNTVGGVAAGAGNLITDSGEVNLQIFGAGSARTVVQGNRIGTDVGGSSILFNARPGTGSSTQVGLLINGAPFSSIGGSTSAASNLISGHQAGIQINGAGSQGSIVAGNFIGTNLRGTAALPNESGLVISSSSGNTVGGLTVGERNLISGNSVVGLRISGPNATNNLAIGNYIGTDVTGQLALGNRTDGVFIDRASNNTVGGTTLEARNVISGNVSSGVQIFDPLATGNVIAGNYIGASASGGELANGGTSPKNGAVGVFINDSPANVIGGTSTESGNLIAHFTNAAVQFNGKGARGNLVANNRIEDNPEFGVVSELEVANQVIIRGANANLFARNGTNVFRFPTAGPTVVNVQESATTSQTVTVSFSRNLDTARASDPRAYRVDLLNRQGRVIGRVPIASAIYDEQSRSVLLNLGVPLSEGGRYRLTVRGNARRGVRDATGIRLDGDLDGVPGGDFMIQLGGLSTSSQLSNRRRVAIRRARLSEHRVGHSHPWHHTILRKLDGRRGGKIG